MPTGRLALGLLVLVLSVPSFGQPTTGSLAGTVVDSAGRPLPGATVEVSGRALQGDRSAVTDDAGRFRFTLLPPGDGYAVTATMEGFRTVRADAIHVYLGQEGTLSLDLWPAVTEELVVVARTPLIDVRSTTSGVNITATQFDSLPTRRTFQSLTAMAPGVSLELGERVRKYATSPAVAGATPPENNYIIEGLSTTAVLDGVSGTNVTMNFVEEIQVMTGGFSAEFGRATGGVFNVITKSGSNDFSGDVFGYYQSDDWSAKNVRGRFRGSSTRADGIDSTDVGFSLGGPIRRDVLWFFAALDPTRATTYTREFAVGLGRYINEEHSIDSRANLFAAKLSWTPSPRHQIVATAFGDPTTREGWLGGPRSDPPTVLRRADEGTANVAVRDSLWAGPLFLEIKAGGHRSRSEEIAITEIGRTVPLQVDVNGSHGGQPYTFDDSASRNSFAIKGARAWERHYVTLGADLEEARYENRFADYWVFEFWGPVNPTLIDVGPKDFLREVISNGTGYGGVTSTSAFLQDEWEMIPGLRLNAGIRYERQMLDAERGIFAVSKFEPDGSVDPRRIGKLALDATWAPRVGVVWDPLRDGRSRVYAHLGRYYESLPAITSIESDGEYRIERSYYSDTIHDNANWFNPTGSPLNEAWVLFHTDAFGYDQNAFLFDSGVKPQYQDEIRVGGEYQFAPSWSAGAHYVNRRIGRVIEDIGLFEDPDNPNLHTGYVISNPGEGEFGSALPTPERDYDSVEVLVQRRQTTNWQFQFSFVSARAIGDYEGLYRSNTNQHAPNLTAYYDLPALQKNAYGKLPQDRPYQLKAYASYRLPFGLTLSEGFLFSAGAPLSALSPELPNGYGRPEIFLKPRGSEGRGPDYWVLDLHADYELPVAGGGLSMIVDVFNATNNNEALVLDQSYIPPGIAGAPWAAPDNLDEYGNPKFNPDLPRSPWFKTPRLYQSPRTIQVGMKYRY